MHNPLLLGSPWTEGSATVVVPVACAEDAPEPGCEVSILVTDGDVVVGSASTRLRPGGRRSISVVLDGVTHAAPWAVWVRATCLSGSWESGPLGATVHLQPG